MRPPRPVDSGRDNSVERRNGGYAWLTSFLVIGWLMLAKPF